jgi:hypothetical protein
MTVIITITADPDTTENPYNIYTGEDRILKNIFNGDYEIFYSGQNQGRLDDLLTDSVNVAETFRIYYRKKNNTSFTFLGDTNISSIIKERTVLKGINSSPQERLQIRLVISAVSVSNTVIHSDFIGSGKYKKAILQHSNFNINVNTNLGFYREN